MATGTNKKGLNYIKEDNETEDSPPSYTQSVYDTGIQLDTIKPNFQNDVYNAGYDQGTQVAAQEAYKDGDYEEAERGTNTAKHLTIASMVIGFLLIVVLAMSLHFHFNS
ncbi:hypothetical protein KUTeg_022669 [Tegillarca granosa]|uniref:Uncharacterized protein n=1 Tax=Tegillarca granosa TaxID=220873 RepID=A0ABQ9DZA1_TEGGR|nr:hypothetical protein KUTeg_022669 [Tegillarca granosa]